MKMAEHCIDTASNWSPPIVTVLSAAVSLLGWMDLSFRLAARASVALAVCSRTFFAELTPETDSG
jgi:hypothetical protein